MMNTTSTTNWQSFKAKLQEHPELELQFQYADQKWVDASYHITEIKQAPIVSVDCGGVMNSWTEIIIQLWEPAQKDNERAMKVKKALSIVELVEKTLPLNPLGIVKVEFGNSQFDTRQMYPAAFILEGNHLIVDLRSDPTQCKAISRGQSCETTVAGEACCTTDIPATKPKIQLAQFGSDGPTCDPESNCC